MFIDRLIKFFTSLRLTVVLLAFAIVIVFLGTLSQVDEGLFRAQAIYFKSFVIGISFHPPGFTGVRIFGHWVPLILPGGYLVGTLLLVNLLAAHIYRFEFSVRKFGIQLAHAGVILLLVGQLATDMLARETQLRLTEGETKSYSESPRNYELAFATDAGANSERVVVIPERLLERGGEVRNPNLPFTIRVRQFWKNSTPQFRAPMMQSGPPLAPNGVALHFDFHPAAEVTTMDDKNVPTAVIEIENGGNSLGDWVISGWTADDNLIPAVEQNYAQEVGSQMAAKMVADLTRPQTVEAGGKKYTFSLRPTRLYFPFSLTLLKATHTIYEGTDIPKDFRSLVQLKNPQTGEDRQVQIYMNAPLRYAGLTFYQYQMDAGEATREAGRVSSSVLQVVRNPGWLTPYVGCAMVGLGLVIQFGFHLVGFISKRK